MPLQLQGTSAGGGIVAEVESATRAQRIAHRPLDVGALGSYKKAMVSGTMAAALAANSPVFSFRTGATNPWYLIRRVVFSMGDLAAFTAGFVTINMFVARSFSASDTGGTAGTLTGNNGKMRTTFATTGIADFRIASTATLTAGTRTKDADPFATIATSVPATAGQAIIPMTNLYSCLQGERPLELAASEGFVIEATVPATGTWQFGVSVEWDEPPSSIYS